MYFIEGLWFGKVSREGRKERTNIRRIESVAKIINSNGCIRSKKEKGKDKGVRKSRLRGVV